MADEWIEVEVAYARADRQELLTARIPVGATVRDAIAASGVCELFPEIDAATAQVGIFSQRVALDHVMRGGDRVEIYRALIADPKQARRARAAAGSSKKIKPAKRR